MSDFEINDTNPEKNAFKWLYFSSRQLLAILLPRFWKLIVLLTILAIIARLAILVYLKLLDRLFMLPEQIVSNAQNIVAPQVLTRDFQFNIFSQTLSFANIMLIILALISIYLIILPSKITSDKNKTNGFRRLFLFFFFVFVLSNIENTYRFVNFIALTHNTFSLATLQIIVFPLSVSLNSINFVLSLLIVYKVMNCRPISFTTLMDKMRKTISKIVLLSAFLDLLGVLITIYSVCINSLVRIIIPGEKFVILSALETIFLYFSGYAIVFAGCNIVIREKKFWPGLSEGLKLYAKVFSQLICIFLLSQGLFWAMNHAFSFINHVHALRPLYLQYWVFYPIKYAIIIFIDMLLIKLFMDFSVHGSAHEHEELSQVFISNE